MLKTRIIGVVLVREGIAVQSIGFRQYLPIGTPEIAIGYLDRWGIDEIVVLEIDATASRRCPLADRIRSYAQQCQVPLSVGGGIAQVSDVERIIRAGADKVVINSAIVTAPETISEAARRFGTQCIVASIDVRLEADGTRMAFTDSGVRPTGLTAQQLAQRAEGLGAGEILITSIDRDGSQRGYDLELIQGVADVVRIPVIACGGAGHPEHMRAAMRCGVSAVAAANFFHFTEHSVIIVKQYLKSLGEPVRLDSHATYRSFRFNDAGRTGKRDDGVLEALRFHYVPEERI